MRRAPLWAQITFGILMVPVVLFILFFVLPFLFGFCRALLLGG